MIKLPQKFSREHTDVQTAPDKDKHITSKSEYQSNSY